MKRTNAPLIGFLLAPLVAAVLGVLLTPLAVEGDLLSKLELLPIFYFFSLMVEIFFGVPLFLLLWRFGAINLWTSLMAGIAVGMVATIVLKLPSIPELRDFMSMPLIAAVSALCFYLIWQRSR